MTYIVVETTRKGWNAIASGPTAASVSARMSEAQTGRAHCQHDDDSEGVAAMTITMTLTDKQVAEVEAVLFSNVPADIYWQWRRARERAESFRD